MKCPKCATQNPDGAQFCGVCGQNLMAEVACASCGRLNPAEFKFCNKCGQPLAQAPPVSSVPVRLVPPPSVPTSFANGRYQVKKFLGKGGKKKVYLAHDTVLDWDVTFALIKTEKLDETARAGIKREAQAMSRLGDHPDIVTVFDFGEHDGQPFMALPLLSGGDEFEPEKGGTMQQGTREPGEPRYRHYRPENHDDKEEKKGHEKGADV